MDNYIGNVNKYLQNEWKKILYNLFLLTVGSLILAVAIKAIIIPNSFLVSGIFGAGLYIYYMTALLSPSVWFLLLCTPIVYLAWAYVSPRFCIYSVFAMVAVSVFVEYLPVYIPIQNPMLIAIVSGAISGIGIGITLRSQGSDGGISIVGVFLNQKYNVKVSQVIFLYNAILFGFGFLTMEADIVFYSIIGVYITAQAIEYVGSLFNDHQAAIIISESVETISEDLMQHLRVGTTLLHGTGGFTGEDKLVLLVVIHGYQAKRLEELVFAADPHAFVIIESPSSVLGSGFSKRKVY